LHQFLTRVRLELAKAKLERETRKQTAFYLHCTVQKRDFYSIAKRGFYSIEKRASMCIRGIGKGQKRVIKKGGAWVSH